MATDGSRRDVELADLRTFVKAAQLGSLAAAGRALGLPRATVTRRLQRIESTLGQRLLNRGGGRFALTAEGRELLAGASGALRGLDDTLTRITSADTSLRGRLRIAAPHTFGLTVVEPILLRFMAMHPNLALTLDLSSRRVDLLADEADIAIRVGDTGTDSLVARFLRSDRLLLCASPDYLAVAPMPEALEDLSRHRILDFRTDTGVSGFEAIDAEGRRRRVPGAKVVLRSNEPRVLLHAARHGVGVALVPDAFAHEDLGAGALVHVLPEWRWPSLDINALYAPGRRNSPGIRAFIDYLVAYLESDRDAR